GVVTFHDVAAYFSAKDWLVLQDWQKELYKNVMREIHAALEGMGYKIINGDVLLKIKAEDQDKGPEPGPVCSAGISPDILMRVRHDEGEAEEEQDTSSPSIPGFDPDLSLWASKEDAGAPEEGKECTPPTDEDADVVSLSDPSFGSFREPLPGISTLYASTRPRPGKRKRRPPQRRSYEQTPAMDVDDGDKGDTKRRPHSDSPPAEQDDWMLHEKLLQCDLCERTFSQHHDPRETSLPCPQCGGTLHLLPNTAGLCHTMRHSDITYRLQGPVG
ncbi:hypothetical protein GDO81_029873, partial [Engystomops pustulosus]